LKRGGASQLRDLRRPNVQKLVVTLPIALFIGCAETDNPQGIARDPSTVSAAQTGELTRNVVARRYAIQALPAPLGSSTAGKAICARRAVVGSASDDSIHQERAIVLDASGVTQLGTLGGASSRGHAGNASGAVVGRAATAEPGVNHAFLYRDGVMSDLGTLGGYYSEAFAINNGDQIVGQSTFITGGDVPSHATLWQDGNVIDLGTLGGAESFARDINDDGLIVGTSSKADEPSRAHAVVWRDGVIEELPAEGAVHSQAAAINQGGTIAGFLVYDGPFHAVIWRDGTVTDLGSFGGSAFALGLDDRGDVVGWSFDVATSRPRAFLYTAGSMIDLEPLVDDVFGWSLYEAHDICDDGRIVGNGWYYGTQRGFVLTPGG
jgi:probable HAF family extracellular repeat protein